MRFPNTNRGTYYNIQIKERHMKLRSRIVQDYHTGLLKYRDRGPSAHLTGLSLWTGEETKCQKKEV